MEQLVGAFGKITSVFSYYNTPQPASQYKQPYQLTSTPTKENQETDPSKPQKNSNDKENRHGNTPDDTFIAQNQLPRKRSTSHTMNHLYPSHNNNNNNNNLHRS